MNQVQNQILDSKQTLYKILKENIIPFWDKNIIDNEFGGYRLNHSTNGKYKGSANKLIYTQVRLVWYYSHLLLKGFGKPGYIQNAEHGYKFINEYMWDEEYGGFYWLVDHEGIKINDIKQLYAQCFALYSFSEFAMASSNEKVSSRADQIFNFIQKNYYDNEALGYIECLNRTLNPIENKEENPFNDVRANLKSLDVHMHTLEAFSNYYRLSKNEIVKTRISELLDILALKITNNLECSFKLYDRNWNPITENRSYKVSFGLCLENLWLMIEACELIGHPLDSLSQYIDKVTSYCIDKGFDKKRGGFYHLHFVNSDLLNKEKVWWVQAECLVATLYLYKLNQNPKFFELFKKTLNWINKYQVDWKKGEWFNTIIKKRFFGYTKIGLKAGNTKSAYHHTRSIIKCIEISDTL